MNKIIIDDDEKDEIVTVYQSGTRTIKQIADCVGVSARTIGRILVEKGAMPAKVKKTKAEERALNTLQAWNIKPGELNGFLQQLEDYGYIDTVDGKALINERKHIDHANLVMRMVYADKDEYESLLTKIIHTREAIKYNVSVQAAMLKLEQQTINAAGKTNEQHQPE